MQIFYKNKKEKALYESSRALTTKYGKANAKKIMLRITQLESAETLEDVPNYGRLHPLHGKKKGELSVSVKEPYRLVFAPYGDYILEDWATIKAIKILKVTDYH